MLFASDSDKDETDEQRGGAKDPKKAIFVDDDYTQANRNF